MNRLLVAGLALLTVTTVSAQNFQSNTPVRKGKTIIIPLPKDASGEDVYPDCNKGKVCLPEAEQCSKRKNKVGATQFEGKTYWFNWNSDEAVLRNAKWNWFTARNYCRKRCMDLVSKIKIFKENELIDFIYIFPRYLLKNQMSGTL